MTKRVCLIHYHEIGLKGKNRARFENKLLNNIKKALKAFLFEDIRRISGHIALFFSPETSLEEMRDMCSQVAHIPGVAKVSLAFSVELSEENLEHYSVLALREIEDFSTFKVVARRSNTSFHLHTFDLNNLCGSALCKAFPEKKVLMKNPDVYVHVHLVEHQAFIWAQSYQGIGGLPVGTGGKVISLLSSGFDSPVATWMLGRRGAVCIPIHFSGYPVVSDTSHYLCQDICEKLQQFGVVGRMYVASIGEYQKEIALSVPDSLRIIMYRKLMFGVAQKLAYLEGAQALVTGESLGQVASQTLENITSVNDGISLPILRPLIGTDKVEIIDKARMIGTYEISEQTVSDCCSLFMPKNPETKSKLEVVRKIWKTLDYERMINEIIENLEYIDFDCPSYKPPQSFRHRHSELS